MVINSTIEPVCPEVSLFRPMKILLNPLIKVVVDKFSYVGPFVGSNGDHIAAVRFNIDAMREVRAGI